jgi:hypothetical protein
MLSEDEIWPWILILEEKIIKSNIFILVITEVSFQHGIMYLNQKKNTADFNFYKDKF